MTTIRKRCTAEFKAHVAFEACREDRTLAQLSSEFGVSSEQICRWKKKLQSDAGRIFFITKRARTRHWEAIGRLTRHTLGKHDVLTKPLLTLTDLEEIVVLDLGTTLVR